MALEKQEQNLTNMKTKGIILPSLCFSCFVCVAGIICFISSLLFDYLKILLDRIASILVLSH